MRIRPHTYLTFEVYTPDFFITFKVKYTEQTEAKIRALPNTRDIRIQQPDQSK